MFIKKEMKYGYSVESTRDNMARIVKPSNLRNIRLTPTNPKFVLYGTRNEILKWMSSHSELLVEYNPLDQNNNEPAFSQPSSPLLSTFPEVPEILSYSPISIPSPSSPTSPSSFVSSHSTDTTNTSISNKPHDITFDLFAIPSKTLIDDSTFSKQRNIAIKLIPWLEVMLEIRPTDEHKDSKLYPVHRVILPSGSSLSEISKALEKSWKNLFPDGSECFIKNSEFFFPHKKSKSNSISPKISNTNSDDVEGNEHHSKEKPHNFMAGVVKRVPTVDFWLRQKQTTGVIPPGILTPYIIDDVLENSEIKKEDEKIILSKKDEAELNKELPTADLPQYETVFNDTLLERGNQLST